MLKDYMVDECGRHKVDLKKLYYSDDYKWLREEYGDRLCFITVSGSWGYGTNVETSDIDIRGVMLPTKEELIGLHSFEQRVDEETDTCIYEFNKFVKLVSDCNPNTIELLGCREYLIFNEVGEELINRLRMFLSKKCIKTFGGYATAQLRRLENALCHDSYPEEEKVKHIKQTMDVAISKLEETNELFAKDSIKPLVEDDKLYMTIHIDKAPIELVRASLNDLLTIEKTYNKLNQRNKKKDEPHLNKHIMHLIRLYLTCFDILEKQSVHTYRNEDKDWLLQIRNGYFLDNGKLVNNFYEYLGELEKRLLGAQDITALPNKPNFKEIEEFVMKINTQVISNTVKCYREPLVVVYL